ncbi:MAG: hypothetical protein WC242_03260 [Candidatus Paceibacterota bacterium]|jgi:hypothetical protein
MQSENYKLLRLLWKFVLKEIADILRNIIPRNSGIKNDIQNE